MKWAGEAEEAFTEVTIKYERFYGCSECFRNFISKEKFNEHVPACNAICQDYWDDAMSPRTFSSSRRQTTKQKQSDQQEVAPKTAFKNSVGTSLKIISTPPIKSNAGEGEDKSSSETGDSSNGSGEEKPAANDSGSSKDLSGHPGLRSSKSKESYECKTCNKIYNTKYGFKLHMRTHTGDKGYACEICGKSFSQSGHLKDHRRIHTGEKPFSCPICDKKFAQNQNLKHHLRMHSGVRPFKCNQCEKTYFTKCELATHERTHSGLKPYQCDSCEKAFSNLQGLKTHLRSHGDDRLYSCPCCKLVFASRRDDFVNHMQMHFSKGNNEQPQNFKVQDTDKTEIISRVEIVQVVADGSQ